MNLDIEPDNHLSLDMQISTQHDHANDVRADLVNSEYGHQSSCDIVQLLAFSVQHKASDLHLSADLPPMVRIDGDITRINLAALDSNDVHNMMVEIMTDQQCKYFENNLEIDFSFEIAGCARFRVNAFNQNRGNAAVFRTIPSEVQSLEALDCPQIFRQITAL